MTDNLASLDIVPVKCPRCGEAQNTCDGTTDPTSLDAVVGCMVCGRAFAREEYMRLMEERRIELSQQKIGS